MNFEKYRFANRLFQINIKIEMPLATELKLLNSKDTTKFELPIIRILRVWLITLIDIDSGGKITENIFYKNRKL